MGPPREIYKIQEEIMAIGLSLCQSFPPSVPASTAAHLRELFEANEYGEAILALKYLEEHDSVDLGGTVRAAIERIEALMARLKVLFDTAESR